MDTILSTMFYFWLSLFVILFLVQRGLWIFSDVAKGTVSLIRKRSYWNFSNLKPRDPVILALCSQETFQKSLEKAKRRVEREKKAKIKEEKKAQAASI